MKAQPHALSLAVTTSENDLHQSEVERKNSHSSDPAGNSDGLRARQMLVEKSGLHMQSCTVSLLLVALQFDLMGDLFAKVESFGSGVSLYE